MTEKLIILTSGGLDSLVANFWATLNGFIGAESLYVDLGQPYAKKEWAAIEKFPFSVMMFPCPTIGYSENQPTPENQIIPGRNMLLGTIAASIGADRIWLGALDGEMHTDVGSRDKTPEFFDLMTGILSFTFKPRSDRVIFETPFPKLSKAEIVRWALDNHVDSSLLTATSSCYHATEAKCGECSTCFKRWVAFTLNGIEESYSSDPRKSQYASQLAVEMEQAQKHHDYSHYSRKRIEETLSALTS